MQKLLIFLIVTICFSCGTSRRPYYKSGNKSWSDSNTTSANEKILSLFLVGDTGEFHDKSQNKNYVLEALKTEIQQIEGASSIVYLGDNIYPSGLPPVDDPSRSYAEKLLDAQLDLSEIVNGNTYFIPGNHDWNEYKNGGLQAIKRQEAHVKAKGKNVKFYPENACGDPKIVKINSGLRFVFIDSQWWLQDWSKEENINKGCSTKSREDLLQKMEEIFLEYKNDEIIVFMHHPIRSNGLHGGHFSLTHHLFPLHEKGIWVPLPIIGSLYPIYRNVIGSKQDIPHALNKELTNGLTSIAKKLKVNVIFVAGHEHGLQYFEEQKLKYIVSGAGSKQTYTGRRNKASYARAATGYAKINFYQNFEAWVEFYTVAGFDQSPVLEYRAQLRAPEKALSKRKPSIFN